MNFLIFLNSRGLGSKFQISSGEPDLWSGGAGPLAPGSYASELWATWKSGPFWPSLRESGRATGQAALPIPTPLSIYIVEKLNVQNLS